ncbi:MAG TPA: hypothetical protein PLV58_11095 [Campylobacterales bacterium]|nr:hypothetical protein [Campylobacterales bacterium]
MKAYFCSEERFLRVIICFDTAAQKKELCDTMDALVAKYEISPTVLIKRSATGGGEVSVEFEDDYNEEAKPLIEEYAQLVGLEFVDNCHVEACECNHVGHLS